MKVRARTGEKETVLCMAEDGTGKKETGGLPGVKRTIKRMALRAAGVLPVALAIGVPMTIGFGPYKGAVGTVVYLSLRELLVGLGAMLSEYSEVESAFD